MTSEVLAVICAWKSMKELTKIAPMILLLASCVGEDLPTVTHQEEVLEKLGSALRSDGDVIASISPHVVSGCMVGAWRMVGSSLGSTTAQSQILVGNQCDQPFTIMNRHENVGDVIARFETSALPRGVDGSRSLRIGWLWRFNPARLSRSTHPWMA